MTRADLDKKPADVAAMFDGVAKRYDRTNDVLSMGQDRRWRTAVVKAVAPRPGERVLDLAAGSELDGGHRRPGRDVEHRLSGTRAQRLARGPAPGGVQTGGEHGVGEVVALRDAVEHRRDVGRPLVQAGPRTGGVCALSPVSHGADATGPPTLER